MQEALLPLLQGSYSDFAKQSQTSPYRISRYELPRCLAVERFREIETLGHFAPHGH
jgi:hypothetical protein